MSANTSALLPVFVALGVGVAMFKASSFFSFVSLARRIEDIPTSKIRALALGPVEIAGTIIALTRLREPISQRSSVYHRVTVYELKARKDDPCVWTQCGTQSSIFVPFHLQDDTGEVLIIPTQSTLELKKQSEVISGMFRPLPPHVTAHLKELGLEPYWLGVFPRKYRLVQQTLAPGDFLYILGEAKVFTLPDQVIEHEQCIQADEIDFVRTALIDQRRYIGAPSDPLHHFLISDQDEETLKHAITAKAINAIALAMLVLVASLLTWWLIN